MCNNTFRFSFLVSTITMCLSFVPRCEANPEIYRKVLSSVGWIIVPSEHQIESGTCYLVDKERKLVLTSRHIVNANKDVLIYFPIWQNHELVVEPSYYLHEVTPIAGRVLSVDKAKDLALIQLDSVPADIVGLPLAEHRCQPGENVHSVGNSGLSDRFMDGALWRYTRGNVRQLYREHSPEKGKMVRLVETQSPVNPGDSGGPIVNESGHAVALTDAYKKGERLVSRGIDVSEMRAFISDSRRALDADAKRQTVIAEVHKLAGLWDFNIKEKDGATTKGAGLFQRDGTFALSTHGDKSLKSQPKGRYAFVNGVAWLIYEDAQSVWSLKWTDRDCFRYESTAAELTFRRRSSSARSDVPAR